MHAYLIDRWGAQVDDVSEASIRRLLGELVDDVNAEEYGTVSVSDTDGWNLEFGIDDVVFENVEADGVGRVGRLQGLSDDARVELALLLVRGDLDAVRSQGWRPETD